MTIRRGMLLRLLLLLATSAARASSEGAIALGVEELGNLHQLLQMNPHCGATAQKESGKTCSQVSDNFCKRLWLQHNGNMNLAQGKILAGSSPKSGLLWSQILDLQALVAAKERLPKDLRERTDPILGRLELTLKNENASREWQRELSDIDRALKWAVEDVTRARARAHANSHTHLGQKLSGVESEYVNKTTEGSLDDQIVRAKYAEHPNWKRAERLFPQAKQAILESIETLPVSAETKQQMRERVQNLKLSLPLPSPEAAGVPDACATTMKDAIHFRSREIVVICAGFFNTYQNDATMAKALLHEISHSVDQNSMADSAFENHSRIGKELNRLKGAKGPVMECAEWDKLEKELVAAPVEPKPKLELTKLYSCLQGKAKIEVWNPKKVREIAKRQTKLEIGKLTKQNSFLKLTKDLSSSSGAMNPNYIRPDLLFLEAHGYPSRLFKRDAHATEIFAQALACQKIEKEGRSLTFGEPGLSGDEQAQLMRKALDRTSALLTKRREEQYSYCQQDCADLVEDGFSRNVQEQFADWLTKRGMWKLLARLPNPENRREASAAANAFNCEGEAYALQREAPELVQAEKEFDLGLHPDSRRRRLSVYDQATAALVGCQIEVKKQNEYGTCEP